MIKAIVFDCFGVLTTDLWKAFLDTVSDREIVDRLRELNRQLDAAFLDRREFLEQVFELTGKQPTEVERLLGSDIAKNTMLFEYIQDLRERGYKIGLLSNISSNWIRDTFLSSQEQKIFDSMLFSHEARMIKPQPEIFELACEKLGVQPQDAIMIDDVLGNCDAAKSIGMKSVYFTDTQSVKKHIESLLIS